MRRASKRRAVALRVYARERTLFLIERSTCERCQSARATDVHHARGRVGTDLLCQENWHALCRECHRRVTEYPAEAYDDGWSVRRIGGDAA